MSSYQNIDDPAGAGAGAGTGQTQEKVAYDSGLPPTNYQYDESYGQGNNAAAGGDGFDDDIKIFGPEMILRGVEIFFTLLAFSIIASIKHHTELDLAENHLLVTAFCFVYCLLVVIAVFMKVQSRYLPNLDIFIFTMDFMFSILLFCSSAALGAKCHKHPQGNDMYPKYCEYADWKNPTLEKSSTNYHKANASVAFGFLASFVFVASTVLSYRKVVETHRQ